MTSLARRGSWFVSLPLAIGVAASAAANSAEPAVDCDGGRCATTPAPDAAGKIQADHFGRWGVDLSGMDRSMRPGDDFNAYANGNWEKTTTLPPDRTALNMLAVLGAIREARIRNLIEKEVAATAPRDGDAAKIGALYQSFVDEARVNALDDAPLRPLIARIRAIKSKAETARFMGQTFGGFGSSIFAVGVAPDAKRPASNALYLGPAGLGLGTREYYLEKQYEAQREAYLQYVEKILTLAKWPRPKQSAAAVLQFETELAKAQWSLAEARDRSRTYNPRTVHQLRSEAPEFPWTAFLAGAGLGDTRRVIITQISAIPRMAKLFGSADLATLKAWQAFQVTDNAAPYLSTRFADVNFDFRQRFLQGQPQQSERWKRAIRFVESAMGQAVGRDYVRLYFPRESKAYVEHIVADLLGAMRVSLQQAKWLSPQARAEAVRKLDSFGVKIGYPDKWKDYSTLHVEKDELFPNAENVFRFQWQDLREKLTRPNDRNEWNLNPQDVNAGYSYLNNDVTFPAGILIPPFFDPTADLAVNYGAIGAVIGHEISHAFDDQGRKTDSRRELRDWWSADDKKRFSTEAAKLGAQYQDFRFPLAPEMRVNPQLTMGENIADLGGLSIALRAYHARLNGRPAPVIDGFSGDQRFFLAWAQTWRSLWRKNSLRQELLNNPHPPGEVRGVAPMRNIDAWYDAFGVRAGDKLYIAPQDRVRIW